MRTVDNLITDYAQYITVDCLCQLILESRLGKLDPADEETRKVEVL
jgi:hypothetical protein